MIWKYKIVASDEYSVSSAKIHYPDDLQLRLIQIIIIVLKISIIDLSPFRFGICPHGCMFEADIHANLQWRRVLGYFQSKSCYGSFNNLDENFYTELVHDHPSFI